MSLDPNQKIEKKFGLTFAAGQVIFREGDSGKELYIIQKGEVKISVRTPKAEIHLATLGPSEFFGEMSLFMKSPRTATAIASKDSVILSISEGTLNEFLLTQKEFTRSFIERLVKRLYATNNLLEEVMGLGSETRILKSLYECWKEKGTRDTTGEKMVVDYNDFLVAIKQEVPISEPDLKRILIKLKGKDVLKFQKDTSNNLYITFTRDILRFFQTAS